MEIVINDASKYIAKALEELRLLNTYEWITGMPANREIEPIIDYLEKALGTLTKT